jgi:hypothetical protein
MFGKISGIPIVAFRPRSSLHTRVANQTRKQQSAIRRGKAPAFRLTFYPSEHILG